MVLSPHRRRFGAFPPLLATLLTIVSLLSPISAAANTPPDPPVIVSPLPDEVPPADVHLEIGAPFHDPDGDAHAASDWEIRTADGLAVAWAAYQSPRLLHAHFSDGEFQGPLEGQERLISSTTYLFRVRFLDSRGGWSAWSERHFTTAAEVVTPLWRARAVVVEPAPIWLTDGGASVSLPERARLTIEAVDGTALLTLDSAGADLLATPGAGLDEAALVRARLVAPSANPVRLPASSLRLVTLDGDQIRRQAIYLPPLTLDAGAEQVFWITEVGSTFYGRPEETEPDRHRLARDTNLPWSLEPGYRIEAVGATFQHPVSLAFVPEPGEDPNAPRFYLTELHGRIKVVTNAGRVQTLVDNLLNITPRGFPGAGEQGVTGICLAPGSRDIYATTVYRAGSGVLRNKIIRLRSPDGLTVTGIDDILVSQPGQGVAAEAHQVQQCSFGPDGMLYVSIGDGSNPFTASDDRFLTGKVLRLNPDGSAPADNPRYDPANPTAPISYQFTKGHRNAFGLAWRPSTGRLYLSENGPEIDRLIEAVPGRDYGWDGTNESMQTHALYNWPEAHWCPTGLTFVDGPAATAFPEEKRDHLFVATYGAGASPGPQRTGKAIQEFVLEADGRIARAPTRFVTYAGEGWGTVIDVKLQPDGLYFTDLFLNDGEGGPEAPGGKVWRIRYAGVASFTASTTTGPAPLTVAFTDASAVPGATLGSWDFGDGMTSTETAPTHTYTRPGRYVVVRSLIGLDGQAVDALQVLTVTTPDGSAPAADLTPRLLPARPTPATVFFPETGATVGGGFKRFWEAHGGLTQFGYPLTNERREVSAADGQEYLIQHFERARFEYHPEQAGTPGEVQLGPLGRESTSRRAGEPAFQPVAPPADGQMHYFPETGHTLSGVFRQHWEQTGGLAIYGRPISEPTAEAWRGKGPTYTVQYFERARMEHHPEAAGTPREMLLTRLGTASLAQQGPPEP